jgi:hypothetical protein
MGAIAEYVAAFAASVASGQAEIYNEFSLQHEFGISLRNQLPDFKVQFERNVEYFFQSKMVYPKREIDITVFDPGRNDLRHAVELKYPRNGQHPEQIFGFCTDVAFAEELHTAGFSTTAAVIFADDHLIYEGSSEGIYGYFRGHQPIHGRIQKPTGSKDKEVFVRGSYSVQWLPVVGSLKYAVVEVGEG